MCFLTNKVNKEKKYFVVYIYNHFLIFSLKALEKFVIIFIIIKKRMDQCGRGP
jgi:hypothetical protein